MPLGVSAQKQRGSRSNVVKLVRDNVREYAAPSRSAHEVGGAPRTTPKLVVGNDYVNLL